MRYTRQPDIVFVDVNGGSHLIKETRELESAETTMTIALTSGSMLDEIATRQYIYGDNAEDRVYKLFDHNAVAIVESGYDLSGIKSLRIPLV